jgi:thiamine pyrophosphate-dependent acetolactate synthase large subunit-like protein
MSGPGGRRYVSVDPGPTDAGMVAQACGLNAARATSLEHLKGVIVETASSLAPVYSMSTHGT